MTEETHNEQDTPAGASQQGSSEAWRGVGEQFKSLGESIAQAFRSAWEDDSNRQFVKEMESGLDSMLDSVSTAINDAAQSPEAQKLRGEAEKVAQSAREAGERAAKDVRPTLLSALRQMNSKVQDLINNLEQKVEAGAGKKRTEDQTISEKDVW